jgi:hypothetical protein
VRSLRQVVMNGNESEYQLTRLPLRS